MVSAHTGEAPVTAVQTLVATAPEARLLSARLQSFEDVAPAATAVEGVTVESPHTVSSAQYFRTQLLTGLPQSNALLDAVVPQFLVNVPEAYKLESITTQSTD
jgi:hypothetical protein